MRSQELIANMVHGWYERYLSNLKEQSNSARVGLSDSHLKSFKGPTLHLEDTSPLKGFMDDLVVLSINHHPRTTSFKIESSYSLNTKVFGNLLSYHFPP